MLTTGISNIHGWLNDSGLDIDMKANAIKNYRAAWNLFRKVHRAGVPDAANKGTPTMVNVSLRLLDKNHLYLPKLGKIRFIGIDVNHSRLKSGVVEGCIYTVMVL